MADPALDETAAYEAIVAEACEAVEEARARRRPVVPDRPGRTLMMAVPGRLRFRAGAAAAQRIARKMGL